MRHRISGILLSVGIAAIFAQPGFAQSTNYQMLPPTIFGTTPVQPCTAGTNIDQVLVFGGADLSTGQSAINCLNGGFTVNPSNNFVGIGTNSPQAMLDVSGAVKPGIGSGLVSTSCSPVGAIEYDSTTNAVVFCSGLSNTWQTMGGSSRTWHNMGANYWAGVNTNPTEEVISVVANANGNGAYIAILTGPETNGTCSYPYYAGDSGITKGAWGYNFGVQGVIPSGWCWKGVAGFGGGASIYGVYALY